CAPRAQALAIADRSRGTHRYAWAMGPAKIPTYLEIGAKRAFAGAVKWPGWCRPGRGEPAALQVLYDSAPRYAKVPRGTRLGFEAPDNASAIRVVERLEG